jgi:hypothetical protein
MRRAHRPHSDLHGSAGQAPLPVETGESSRVLRLLTFGPLLSALNAYRVPLTDDLLRASRGVDLGTGKVSRCLRIIRGLTISQCVWTVLDGHKDNGADRREQGRGWLAMVRSDPASPPIPCPRPRSPRIKAAPSCPYPVTSRLSEADAPSRSEPVIPEDRPAQCPTRQNTAGGWMSALSLANSHVPVIAESAFALKRDPVTLDTCRVPPGCGTIRPVAILNHILPGDEGTSSHQREILTGGRIFRVLPIRLADPSINNHQDYERGYGERRVSAMVNIPRARVSPRNHHDTKRLASSTQLQPWPLITAE